MLAVLLLAVGCAVPQAGSLGGSPGGRSNVLLLCVDDLRPELGCYGAGHMRTPHLDALAAEGVLFARHFVQVPTCGASRASMLTGRYPRSLAALGNGAFAALPRDDHAHLPGWFRAHGYRTISIGKITHTPDGSRRQQGGRGDGGPQLANAWHQYGSPAGRWGDAWSAFFGYSDGTGRRRGKTPALEQGASAETPDVLIADAAIEQLQRLRGVPFFLAVGFYKPHLPHNAPRAAFEPYPLPNVGLPPNRTAPTDVDPKLSLHSSGELLRNYGGHPRGGLANDDYVKRLRQAYYACVSHVDAQIGRVLAALRENGLDRNTIVVVWGDHGYHLGEHGVWAKHTLHDRAVRSALIIRAPAGEPGRCDACVESVDLFPTLAELCDLPAPDAIDGRSLVPRLRAPESRSTPDRDDRGARSFWRRGRVRGRTVRTTRWRFTEWRRAGKVVQRELYDHESDPLESRNVAAAHPAEVAALTARLGEPLF